MTPDPYGIAVPPPPTNPPPTNPPPTATAATGSAPAGSAPATHHAAADGFAIAVPAAAARSAAPPALDAGVAERLRRALDVALASPDPLRAGAAYAASVVLSDDIDADGGVVGFTLTMPAADVLPAEPAARAAAMIRVGALMRRITAAGWAADLEVEALLAARGDGSPPAVRITARSRLQPS